MKLKDCSALIFWLIIGQCGYSQYIFQGVVVSALDKSPVTEVEIYLKEGDKSYFSDENGVFTINDLSLGDWEVVLFSPKFQTLKDTIFIDKDSTSGSFLLEPIGYELSEVVIAEKREELFALKRLKEVEGTAIYAGKKTEVVLLDQLIANLATNNARQVYSQITGLNIYESDDGGLQLSIGGRGLDPNRSANFNIRQNGYDISADVLGYPESYYTPPAAALKEIQIVRGAASLQYGTQFGGLVNFTFKQPPISKKFEWTSRHTYGSNDLFSSFNSVGGTIGKFSYYSFFDYKQGDGFRPNSGFDAKNAFAHLGYQWSRKTKLEFEFTYLNYLAQQAGGLTDAQFINDPTFSNRTRNWFEVNWLLYSLKLKHTFSTNTELSINLFGLDAERSAVGFRTNRVSQTDDLSAPRDLIVNNFHNWGVESRLLHKYELGSRRAVFLIGTKYYQSRNSAIQGPGTNNADPDFQLALDNYPNYPNQSDFFFPNLNLVVFGEHIFYLSDNFSLTPGIRLEHIKTESEGTFRRIDFDLAGNPIRNAEFEDNRTFERNFLLLGLGASWKLRKQAELYGNVSQNYRSVTFADIRVVNPSFQVDPNISDENGFTADGGIRGRINAVLSYDIGGYALLYDDRLGEVLRAEQLQNADGELIETGRVVRFRGNIGKAVMYGFESLVDWNIRKTFFKSMDQFKWSWFANTSITRSEYLSSEIPGVEGNEVEFVPLLNLKSGINFGYKNLLGNVQYTFLSDQFTDASNAPQNVNDNQNGIIGAIPSYNIWDVSLSYVVNIFKLEAGLNNFTNESYFTRRATGYPGPGIIPSTPRTFYLTLQMTL